MNTGVKRVTAYKVVSVILLVLFALLFAFPLYWIITGALKTPAEAEAMRIKATALERNQKLVEYEAVQKWNGELPEYMGSGAVPFLNLK